MPLGVGHLNLVLDPHRKVSTFIRPMWFDAEVIFLPHWWATKVRKYNCVEYANVTDLPDLASRHTHPIVFVDANTLDVQYFLNSLYLPDTPYPELDVTAILLRKLPGTVYVYASHKYYSIAKIARCFDRILFRRLPSFTEAKCDIWWDASVPKNKYDTPIEM